jgi:hypothetical protein
VRWAAAARAADPGGIRCLDRWGAASVNEASAPAFNAVTWPWSATTVPVPWAATWWRATTIPAVVAMSMVDWPRRAVTVTADQASSGGTE